MSFSVRFFLLFVLVLFAACRGDSHVEKTEYFSLEEASELPLSVISLNLESDSLTAFPEIWNFKNLKFLTLSNNFLSEVPSEISHLENLEYINLKDNDISRIDKSIGKLQKLKTVYLMFNPLEVLPESLCETSALRDLNISGCGQVLIPDCLRTYPGLRITSD